MAVINLGRVAPFPRGQYSALTEYNYFDLVIDNGSSYLYINKLPSTGSPLSSTSHWQQIASQGLKGDTGAKITSAAWSGNDLLLTLDDTSTVTLTGAKTTLKGDPGDISNIKVDGATKTKSAGVVDLTSDFARYALWRKTAAANPVSVYPVPESPLYPKVSGTFTQAGTGDPSPSNIRPITPWLASGGTVNIVQTGGATITLTAPQEIPAGRMDNEGNGQVTWVRKVFNGTEVINDYRTADWTSTFRKFAFTNACPGIITYGGLMSHSKYSDSLGVSSYTPGMHMAHINGNLLVGVEIAGVTDVATYKAYLAAQYSAGTPVTLLYQLATPISIAPAAVPLTALPQVDRLTPRSNVLTASTGNIELTYAKSPIREADDIAAAIAAL